MTNIEEDLKGATPRAHLAFLAKDSLFFGFLGAAAKLSALLTFPVIARVFSMEHLGLIDAITVIETLLLTVATLGQDSALARFLFDIELKDERRKLFTGSLILQLVSCLVFVLTAWILAEPILNLMGLPSDSKVLISIVLLKAPLALLLNFYIGAFKWLFMRKSYVVLTLFFTVTNALVVTGVALTIGDNVKALLLAQAAVTLLFALIGTWLARDLLVVDFYHPKLHKMLRYGLPFALIYLAAGLVPSVDRSVVSNNLGLQTLAVYAVAWRVAGLFRIVIGAFQTAWGPFSLAVHREEGVEESYNAVLIIYALIICSLAGLATWSGPVLIEILAGEQYRESASYFPFLVLALVIQSIGWITSIGSTIAKRSDIDLVSYLAQLLTLCLVVDSFSLVWGLTGVVVAVVASYIVQALVMTVLSMRAHSLRLELKRPLMIVGVAVIAALGLVVMNRAGIAPIIYFNCGFLVFLSQIFLCYKIMVKEERALLMSLVSGVWKGVRSS